MSRSGQSSRSTSSYSSDKIPLSFQSDYKQRTTYDSASYDNRYPDSRYTTTLSEPRSASSSSKSGRSSKSDKIPLSLSQGSPSGEGARSKRQDERYYTNSLLDDRQPKKKSSLSYQKENDERYYSNSSYYR